MRFANRKPLFEIEKLKRVAEAKTETLESEITMPRDEVKSLRLLLSGEEMGAELGQKKKRREEYCSKKL